MPAVRFDDISEKDSDKFRRIYNEKIKEPYHIGEGITYFQQNMISTICNYSRCSKIRKDEITERLSGETGHIGMIEKTEDLFQQWNKIESYKEFPYDDKVKCTCGKKISLCYFVKNSFNDNVLPIGSDCIEAEKYAFPRELKEEKNRIKKEEAEKKRQIVLERKRKEKEEKERIKKEQDEMRRNENEKLREEKREELRARREKEELERKLNSDEYKFGQQLEGNLKEFYLSLSEENQRNIINSDNICFNCYKNLKNTDHHKCGICYKKDKLSKEHCDNVVNLMKVKNPDYKTPKYVFTEYTERKEKPCEPVKPVYRTKTMDEIEKSYSPEVWEKIKNSSNFSNLMRHRENFKNGINHLD